MELNDEIPLPELIDKLRTESKKCKSIDDFIGLSYSFNFDKYTIEPSQIKSEIEKLFKILQKIKPKTILEIGTSNGGTLFLLCKIAPLDSSVISIDLPHGPFGGELYPDWKTSFYKSFMDNYQNIHLLRSDSHKNKTLLEVKKILAGKKIDFLLIDGDHTYEGVKKDFEMYASLVRKGGLIAFHDINHGTKDHVGEVPRFWQEIKNKYPHIEIIDDKTANGYGIGILFHEKDNNTLNQYSELLQIIINAKSEEALKFQNNPLGLLYYLHTKRKDLQDSFPDVKNGNYDEIIDWASKVSKKTIDDSDAKIISKFGEWYEKYQQSHQALQENQVLRDQHSLLNKNIEEKNSVITELETIRENNEKKITELEQQASQLKQKDALLEQQASQLKQKDALLEQQASQLQHMRKETRQYERTITELEITREDQSNKIDNLEEKLQNSNARESLLTNELDSIHNSVLFNLTRRIAMFLDKTCPPNTLLGRVLRKIAYRFYGKENNTHALTIMPTEFSYGYEFDDFIDEKTQTAIIESFDTKPTISIIMPVYNTEPLLLKKAILSVKKQYYSNWQLCICDDGSSNNEIRQILKKESSINDRIIVTYSYKNEGIISASNKALSLATGEYTLLLDHDDELARNALLEVVNAINKDKDVDFIYSDEDKIDQKGIHIDPFFKPDWSPDLLFSYNYTIHVSVYRTSKLKEIGGFRNGFEGSQDYDLNLRYLEHVRKVVHIPKVLYSWRKTPGSTALNLSEKSYAFTAGKKALVETLQRRRIDAECEDGIQLGTYRIKYRIKEKPLITIIIPTRTLRNLKKCIESIIEKSTYKNIEIIVMDSSKDSQIKKFCENVPQVRCESVHMQKFNFAKVNNDGVQKSNGKYVIFLNDDTEVITPEWIEGLLEHAQRDEIGIVGAKLLYPDGRIQHAGTVIGIQYHGGNYGGMYENDDGYFSYPKIIRDCCAVTAACMMMKKDFFNKIGGYDERLAKSWQDVDLCIRVIRSDKLIIYTPYSVLYHYEGRTRGAVDISGEELEARRLFREKNLDFIERGDPYYNPNLSLVIPFRVVKNYIKPIRVLADLYELRSDLRQTFPNEQKNSFKTLIDWAATSGILTDDRRDVLQKHYDFYFENSSKEAKPLAMIVKQYMENKELQKKFPEVTKGNLDSLIKFMNTN